MRVELKRVVVACCAVLLLRGAAQAQWVNYPSPGIPRTGDGKPNLNAATPRTPDGKPDLSGVWQPANYTHLRNVMADMPPEDVPLEPWAAAVYEARTVKDDPAARCLPAGIPRAFNNIFKVLQTPEVVAVLYESYTQFRQIFTDGRPLPVDPNPSWFGYSVGHWEGDVFVVEALGFNDQTWLDFVGHPHTERLHVSERYRRRDFGHMDVEVTIDDPGGYTRPFTVTYPLVFAVDTDVLETICDNEEQIRPRLIGTDPAHPPTRKSIAVDPAVLARYVGTYELGPGQNVITTIANNRLVMHYPTAPDPLTMFPETPERFFFTIRPGTIEFQTDATGSATALVIYNGTETRTLRRTH